MALRRTNMKAPEMASTSMVLGGKGSEAISTGEYRLILLKNPSKPKARPNPDQRSGMRLRQPACSLPSGLRMTHPAMPDSGCRSMTAHIFATVSGRIRQSGFRKRQYSPITLGNAALHAPAKPRLLPFSTMTSLLSSPKASRNDAILPSVEPLSETTSRMGTVESRTERTQSMRSAPPL